jgi:hypothetical protein
MTEVQLESVAGEGQDDGKSVTPTSLFKPAHLGYTKPPNIIYQNKQNHHNKNPPLAVLLTKHNKSKLTFANIFLVGS